MSGVESLSASPPDAGAADELSLVVVTQHYPPDKSGNASRVRDTCHHLLDEGWEVTVVAPPPAFPHGEFERSWRRHDVETRDGVEVHRLWAWQPTGEDPSFASRLAYYLLFPLHALLWLTFSAREHDVLLTSSPPIFTALAALPFGLLGVRPWVVDVRDLWIDASVGLGFIAAGGLLERVSRRYQSLVLRTADRVSVTTERLGERLVSAYDVDEAKLIHLPNGVETDRFETDDTDVGSRIVYTGNVGHAQDLETCIRALTHLNGTAARLTIVGNGDVRPELETLAADLDVDDRVEFTGVVPREEIPDILSDAAVGVAPLKDDPTLEYAVPTKVYEYMAASTPVVATGSGEIEHLIEAAGGGYVDENDPEAVAETFEQLLSDRQLRAELGNNGHEHIRRHYDRESIARRLDETLRTLVAPGSPGDAVMGR